MSKFKNSNYEAGSGTATDTFVDLVLLDSYRTFFQFQNKGDESIFLYFGGGPATTEQSLEIPVGAFYEPFTAPVDRIQVAVALGGASQPYWFATDSNNTVVDNS